MRGAAAGRSRRAIFTRRAWRHGFTVAPDNRRRRISVTERQAVGHDAVDLDTNKVLSHLAPRFGACGSRHGDLGMGRLCSFAGVAHVGMSNVTLTDRAPLRLVAVE